MINGVYDFYACVFEEFVAGAFCEMFEGNDCPIDLSIDFGVTPFVKLRTSTHQPARRTQNFNLRKRKLLLIYSHRTSRLIKQESNSKR